MKCEAKNAVIASYCQYQRLRSSPKTRMQCRGRLNLRFPSPNCHEGKTAPRMMKRQFFLPQMHTDEHRFFGANICVHLCASVAEIRCHTYIGDVNCRLFHVNRTVSSEISFSLLRAKRLLIHTVSRSQSGSAAPANILCRTNHIYQR